MAARLKKKRASFVAAGEEISGAIKDRPLSNHVRASEFFVLLFSADFLNWSNQLKYVFASISPPIFRCAIFAASTRLAPPATNAAIPRAASALASHSTVGSAALRLPNDDGANSGSALPSLASLSATAKRFHRCA